MAENRFVEGVICTLTGAMLWGFSGAGIQLLQSDYGVQPLLITTVRMLGAGLIFLVMLLARQRDQLRAMLHGRRTLARLIVFGCVGLFACQLTYIFCIRYTNAGTSTALQGFSIVFIVIATCFIRKKVPNVFEVLGMCTAFAATLFIATKGDFGTLVIPLEGLVWGLVSALTVAFYVMYPKRLFDQWGSMPVTGLGMLFGGILSVVLFACGGLVGMPPELPALDTYSVLVFIGVVLFGTVGAFGLFLRGIYLIGSVKASQLGAIEPVSATCFSLFWLGTVFTWGDWVGLALMVATVFVVSMQPRDDVKGGMHDVP